MKEGWGPTVALAQGGHPTPPFVESLLGLYFALTPSSCTPVEEIALNPSTFLGLEAVIMLRKTSG